MNISHKFIDAVLNTAIRVAIIASMVLLFLLGLSAMSNRARGNPIQDAWDAGITNGAVGGGYWRSTSGNLNIASYDLIYNLTKNSEGLGAGLIVGGDYMWSGKNKGVWNDVKGGFTLNYKLAPLKTVGMTNFIVTIYGGDAVATPRSSDVGIGNIAFVGADWAVKVYKRIDFHIAPAYQTRTGQGEFDKSYVGLQGFFSLGF